MIRPFLILAGWAFLFGYLPQEARSGVAALFLCSLFTALTEWIIGQAGAVKRSRLGQ
jgi:hypothetical protein